MSRRLKFVETAYESHMPMGVRGCVRVAGSPVHRNLNRHSFVRPQQAVRLSCATGLRCGIGLRRAF